MDRAAITTKKAPTALVLNRQATSPFRTSQRRPPRDLLISIDAVAIKTNA